MTVNINPNTTVQISPSQIIQTPQMQNAGTVTNAGTTQQFRSNVASGSGQGVGSAAKKKKLFSSASGNGLGFGSASTIRQTQRKANGTGIANGTANSKARLRLSASGFGEGIGVGRTSPIPFVRASGVGTATGTAFSDQTRSTTALGFGEAVGTALNPIPFDAVEQIVQLLKGTRKSRWRYGKPERIDAIWEYSHNDRVNFPNPALYIYTPSEASVDKFGIEAESFNQTVTIEVLVMTLEPTETQSYISDLTSLITQLYDDNTANTQFHRFANITVADLRNEHVPQQTDHYIGTVTFEIQRFASTNPAQSVGGFR